MGEGKRHGASGLRWWEKGGYGVADLGLTAGELLFQLYLFELYTRVAGLSAGATGLALGLAVVWDAVSDPLMGMVIDRTRGRYGRFIPYLAAGSVAFPLSLVLLFNPPALASEGMAFAYLLFSYIMANTGLTLMGIPHVAMVGAISKDTDERTELYGWRLFFGTMGLFVGILMPLAVAYLAHYDVETEAGLAGSRGGAAWAAGGVILVTAWITIAATWRRGRQAALSSNFELRSLVRGLSSVFSNPVFRPMLAAFVVVAIARTMNTTLALPYYKVTLELKEQQVQGIILSVFCLCIVASIPLWVLLGRRFGKKWPGFTGMVLIGLMTMVVYPLFPAGELAGPIGAAIFGGITVSAIVLFDSMVTDVTDYDLLQTGEDREGLYFGFYRMGQKLARSAGLGMSGALTAAIGYEAGVAEQSEETARRLAWVFGPGVGLFFLLGAAIFAFSPLTKRMQHEIGEKLAQRNHLREDIDGRS